MQQQGRYREVVAELLEAVSVFGKFGDARGDHEKADQCEQAEHQRIARQHGGIAPDRAPLLALKIAVSECG